MSVLLSTQTLTWRHYTAHFCTYYIRVNGDDFSTCLGTSKSVFLYMWDFYCQRYLSTAVCVRGTNLQSMSSGPGNGSSGQLKKQFKKTSPAQAAHTTRIVMKGMPRSQITCAHRNMTSKYKKPSRQHIAYIQCQCVDQCRVILFVTLTPGKVTAEEAQEPIIRAMKVERRSPNMLGSQRKRERERKKEKPVRLSDYHIITTSPLKLNFCASLQVK